MLEFFISIITFVASFGIGLWLFRLKKLPVQNTTAERPDLDELDKDISLIIDRNALVKNILIANFVLLSVLQGVSTYNSYNKWRENNEENMKSKIVQLEARIKKIEIYLWGDEPPGDNFGGPSPSRGNPGGPPSYKGRLEEIEKNQEKIVKLLQKIKTQMKLMQPVRARRQTRVREREMETSV